jgi:hypothetical protein
MMETSKPLDNQRYLGLIERAIKEIDDKIDLKTEQLNGTFATPTKNNRSPNEL